jgi:hypothetical protein
MGRAAGDVHPVEIGLVGGDELVEQQAPVVQAPVEGCPVAMDLRHPPLAAEGGGVGHVDVHVVAVAGVAAVGEEPAVARPERRDVAVGAVGEASRPAGPAVEQEELEVLRAPLVEGIDDLVGIARPVGGRADRIVVEGELGARAQRHPHLMELRALREARQDQQAALPGMPVREPGGAQVLVGKEVLEPAGGNGRHALGGDALRHRQDLRTRGCRPGWPSGGGGEEDGGEERSKLAVHAKASRVDIPLETATLAREIRDGQLLLL